MVRLRGAAWGAAGMALGLLASMAGCDGLKLTGQDPTPLPISDSRWALDARNPVIKRGQDVAGMVWNDPTVLKEHDTYRMWLSGGLPISPITVSVFHATSADGVSWKVDPTPQIQPGAAGAWDGTMIETPSVIKVGDTYHLYYCGCLDCSAGQYSLGHATSTDGVHWTKDPRNPILTHQPDPSHWGFYTAAEPGAVHDPRTGKIYLFFTTLKGRPGGSGDTGAMFGISVAESTDGSHFTPHDPDHDGHMDAVLTQSDHYPATHKYVGYSTPMALIDAQGKFHLYYDVAGYPTAGVWEQLALAHAEGPDPFHFTEVETDLVVANGKGWSGWEVRAPFVLQEGNQLRMWFAGMGGHNDLSQAGIGTATRSVDP